MNRRYGDAVAHSYGLDTAPLLTTGLRHGPQLTATHIICGPEHLGVNRPVPPEDAFIVGVNLTEMPHHELWSRGQIRLQGGFEANTMRILPLAEGGFSRTFIPHEMICFYIPRASLDVITDLEGIGRVGNLACAPGIYDTTVANLAKVIALSLPRPLETSIVFTNQVMLALCAHLIDRYSDKLPATERTARERLTSAQANRVKEILAGNLKGDLPIGDLARECGVPRMYLIRAFQNTTGSTPHQWLQWKRVDQAMSLLKNTSLPLGEVAQRCGFTNQAHLTRVFNTLAQARPEVWRRQNQN